MKRNKLSTKTSVKVSQRITLVKCVVAGSILIAVIGIGVFIYLNLGSGDDAEAANRPGGDAEETVDNTSQNTFLKPQAIDFSSYLNADEMSLLIDRDFVRDTTRKEYESVKWNLDSSYSHITLEVVSVKHAYSLEVFNKNGERVLYFANLTDKKFSVDKIDLVENHEYIYLVKNTAGELYAGNLRL